MRLRHIRIAKLRAAVKIKLFPAGKGGEMGSNFDHYLRLVKVLEQLKRESDLEMGPKLMNRILDAQLCGELTPEEALQLTERIHRWLEKMETQFSSQEYQMRKLLRAMERDDKRLNRIKKKPYKGL